ncbi:MAG TPA: cupin domain-containing protein [Gaiellaceae bacterium]|nr:cupin domain-containing protein [Gaiellaceae bacterium]
MAKAIALMSMSLDGYVADENDGVDEVFDWYFSGDVEIPIASTTMAMTFRVSPPSADHLRRLMTEVGAMLTGRRTFERADALRKETRRGARIAFVRRAQLEDFGSGMTPITEGWFVVNVRDAEWWFTETRGARCAFENEYGDPPVEFGQLGINVTVLESGQTSLYHAEANQEAFLVLSGECALIVENEERRLRPWEFFHAPAWTEHAFVGAGEGPCAILMVGSRSGPEVHYPVSERAAGYGASVAEETSDWRQAYATVERFRRERPPSWALLPWA